MAMTAGPGALRVTITEKFLSASRVAATCCLNEKSDERRVEGALGDDFEDALDDIEGKERLSTLNRKRPSLYENSKKSETRGKTYLLRSPLGKRKAP